MKNEPHTPSPTTVWDPASTAVPPTPKARALTRRTVLWSSVAALVLGGGAAVYLLTSPPAGAAQAIATTPTPTTVPTASTTPSTPSTAVAVVTPTMIVQTHPVAVVTPAAQSGGSATHVSGSIQCQVGAVEGIWIQAANGGSGWAPWNSTAARASYATYSYTLPHGGEYSAEIGCGGTPSAWAAVEYTTFHTGKVNDFYCYDQPKSALYSYCKEI
jgi:hypothetical protein